MEVIKLENIENAYVEFIDNFLHFRKIEGEITKECDDETRRNIIKIRNKYFGVVCLIYAPNDYELIVATEEDFMIDAMMHLKNNTLLDNPFYMLEHEYKTEMYMQRMNFTNHNCENAKVIKIMITYNFASCVFEYYEICLE
jgi:hypothetical protein